MIGTTVEAKRRRPFSAILLASIACIFLICAAFERKDRVAYWTAAGLFGMAATVRWLMRQKPLYMEFHEDSVEFQSPDKVLAYSELTGLRTQVFDDRAAARPYLIEILFAGGSIEIPARTSVPSCDIEQFLSSKIAQHRLPSDPAAREHLEQMVGEFGVERVWWTNGTPVPKRSQYNLPLLLSGGLLAASGLIVLLLTSKQNRPDALAGVSAFALVIGILLALCSLVTGRRVAKVKDRSQAVVIVTPLGVAVTQGDLRGEARWGEIRDIGLRRRRALVLSAEGQGEGLLLRMDGVTITLFNIYDRPLGELYRRMTALWR